MSGFNLIVDVDDEGLAAAFEQAPAEMAESLLKAVKDSAAALQRDWRSNARAAARRHGKRYPSTITNTVLVQEGSLYADIGPESARPQGGMGAGFEYGSVHQPPHMDGARAFATNAEKFDAAVDEAIARVVDGL